MKPYIICYMMSSLDGRIDCEMTEKIEGSKEYYEILDSLKLDACLSGKTTAKMHYANKEIFIPIDNTKVLQEKYFKAKTAKSYNIVTDTLGTLTWDSNMIGDSHLIILLSENTTNDYLNYLKNKEISYIVCGKDSINLSKATEILYGAFSIERLGVVGGGNINAAFLKERLFNEIDVLIGPGINGRKGQVALFDGLEESEGPYRLTLLDVRKYDNGSIYLKYEMEE